MRRNVGPLLSSLLLAFLVGSGCLDRKEAEPEYVPIAEPSTYTSPTVDGDGVREPSGVWFHDAELSSWAFFLQEISRPSDAASIRFDAQFIPSRAPGERDAMYMGNVIVEALASRSLSPVLDWGEVGVGAFAKVEHGGPVRHVGTGRMFVASFAVTTVPGHFRLAMDFGGSGSARWNPALQGQAAVTSDARSLESGKEIRLSKSIEPNSTVMVLIGNDGWKDPAWRNITLGHTQPYLIELDGFRTSERSANTVSAAGFLSYPETPVPIALDYRGPNPSLPVVILTMPSNLAGWMKEHAGLDFMGRAFGRDYEAP
jgi:hypothetical protein